MEDVMIMRLQCACGRNLADVTVTTDYNADWVFPINHYVRRPWRSDRAHLMVTPRSNVDQREHHMRPGPTMERTYSWRCRCGQNPQKTAKKIAVAWDARTAAVTTDAQGRARKVVVVVLDVDL
jgi:hypothetical protein